jgi:hypothetical protein
MRSLDWRTAVSILGSDSRTALSGRAYYYIVYFTLTANVYFNSNGGGIYAIYGTAEGFGQHVLLSHEYFGGIKGSVGR